MKRTLLNVNGIDRWVVAEKTSSLADVLREQMLLTGCKVCCEDGQCGSCTVLVDGKPNRSCQQTDGEAGARREGHHHRRHRHGREPASAANRVDGTWRRSMRRLHTGLHHVREGAARHQQDRRRAKQVRGWFNRNRNLCRCTGYKPLTDAVMDAAAMMRGEKKAEDVLAAPKADGSILGPKYQRPSALAKVTGTWDFGADVALRMPENTLRLALVQAKVSRTRSSRASTPPKPRRCPA